jgi:hypothetical protein
VIRDDIRGNGEIITVIDETAGDSKSGFYRFVVK